MHFFLLFLAGLWALTQADDDAHRHIGITAKEASNKASPLKQITKVSTVHDKSIYRYLSSKTKPYLVTTLPDFNFNIGEFYSGEISIGDPDPTIFFAFKPSTGPQVDEITIWLNGDPGCSSLKGFLQENGPWTWQPGTFLPMENPYAWSTITNMLWIEQPGEITEADTDRIAEVFLHFLEEFQQIFSMSGYKIYLAGEGYAARYIAYIGHAMLKENDKNHSNLSGAMLIDPHFGTDTVQFNVNVAPFAIENKAILNLNDSTLATLTEIDEKCGFDAFREKYFQFPPPSSEPEDCEFPEGNNYKSLAGNDYEFPEGTNASFCDIAGRISDASSQVNPCFNPHNINTQCPLPWDVLGSPNGWNKVSPGPSNYFDREDVKKAMHAPLNVTWFSCTVHSLFAEADDDDNNHDDSPRATVCALPAVIEATNRTLITNGDLDMLPSTNGTLLAIQNMTWANKTGFQSRPNTPIIINQPDLVYGKTGPQGTIGIQHYERGLMWAEALSAGSMQSTHQPRATLRYLQWVLGRIDRL